MDHVPTDVLGGPSVLDDEGARRADVVDALRIVRDELPLRKTAENPNLCVGRVEVFHTLAIDLSEIVADRTADVRLLQRLRASDSLFELLRSALIGKVDGCDDTADSIKERMDKSLAMKGKAVWTDHFLERHAPIRLPSPEKIEVDGEARRPNDRISAAGRNSSLEHVTYVSSRLQIFRDGTIGFTIQSRVERGSKGQNGQFQPASIAEIVERLAALRAVAEGAFRDALAEFVQPDATRNFLSEYLKTDEGAHLRVKPANEIRQLDLRRQAQTHTVIFLDRFYDGEKIALRYAEDDYSGTRDSDVEVPLHEVLASSALAGILNTASWYQRYNSRYVRSVTRKEIGYRDDEIYLTDSKASVAVNAGFWDSTDSLSHYRYDIVLAAEYNTARLAYFAAILSYYQQHPDVRNLDSARPIDAMPRVVDGQAILLLIDESLDLTLLMSHGFTRLFARRLQEELGFRETLGFIRQRVADASSIVALRSSVDAAENTSKKSLAAALAGNDLQAHNNNLQGAVKKLTALAILLTLLLAGVQVWIARQPSQFDLEDSVCVTEFAPSEFRVVGCPAPDLVPPDDDG